MSPACLVNGMLLCSFHTQKISVAVECSIVNFLGLSLWSPGTLWPYRVGTFARVWIMVRSFFASGVVQSRLPPTFLHVTSLSLSTALVVHRLDQHSSVRSERVCEALSGGSLVSAVQRCLVFSQEGVLSFLVGDLGCFLLGCGYFGAHAWH